MKPDSPKKVSRPQSSKQARLDGRIRQARLSAGLTKAEVLGRFGGQGFGVFKPALAELAVEVLGPVGARMRQLLGDPAELDRILAKGAERAREVADPIVAETKRLVGFWGS